ncbi:Venom carboxylesterase-6, partial [Pseudolycoriella hygida]
IVYFVFTYNNAALCSFWYKKFIFNLKQDENKYSNYDLKSTVAVTMATWSVLVLNVLFVVRTTVSQNPFVCINNINTCVEGVTVPATSVDDSFEVFYGIPYAAPPIGNLRFANPVPFGNWFGTLNATQPKEDCIQKFIVFANANVTGVEDCLYLNVYRPIMDFSNTRLPVIVWIHGGGFFGGSATADRPEIFLNTKEVIWVSMAYRLGALGFLSTGDEYSPGNFGLKDQSMALQWVKENIDAFGGNASSITLMGVSAGAAAVHMHMMSPLSQGLFHRAIVMSGSALAPYNEPVKDPLSQAMQQAKLLGIEPFNTADLIFKLRSLDAHTIVDAIEGMKYWDLDPLTTYKTVIEANVTGAFMIEHPLNISLNGNYLHIPWITGVVEHEGAVRAATILTNQTLLDDLNEKFDDLLPFIMEVDIRDENNTDEIVEKIKEKYFNGSNIDSAEKEQRLVDMYSDRAFLYPYYKMVQHFTEYSDANETPLGLYRFMFQGTWSYSYFMTGSDRDFGVVHLDDTIYMFRSELPLNNPVYNIVTSNLTDFYVSFAKTGIPKVLSQQGIIRQCNSHAMADGSFCDYQEFDNSDNGNNLDIRIRNEFDAEMIEFWDNIFELAQRQRGGSSHIQLNISALILTMIFVVKLVDSL